MRRAVAVVLSDDERRTLTAVANGRRSQVRHAQRARIVLLAADGLENRDIATRSTIALLTPR